MSDEDVKKPEIIVICGPTGIGKTSTAIGIAKALNGKIISADSMQVYRYMDIGTAKPTLEERQEAHHDLIDVADPDEDFDAARFSALADGFIKEYQRDGFVPVVAGGTGLYIKSLVSGLFRARPVDSAVVERLEREADEMGTAIMHERLVLVDPKAADRIHPNDRFRILRALEIFATTGKPISEYHAAHGFADQPYRVLKIGLSMDRELLYQRINKRVDLMIEQGLLGEVESLISMGYSPSLKSMGSLGYRHMADYLKGQFTFDEAVTLLKRDTRRYAKRQMTWFRADSDIQWFEPGDVDAVIEKAVNFLNETN
jgi:tRNA dimethylallyltransferase